jgi:hypothetical protein
MHEAAEATFVGILSAAVLAAGLELAARWNQERDLVATAAAFCNHTNEVEVGGDETSQPSHRKRRRRRPALWYWGGLLGGGAACWMMYPFVATSSYVYSCIVLAMLVAVHFDSLPFRTILVILQSKLGTVPGRMLAVLPWLAKL